MKRSRLVGAACALLLSAASGEPAIRAGRAGQRWALIVSTGGASRGSAQALARVLSDRYGFGADSVVLLNDAEATGARLQEAMGRLQAGLRPYDALFVYLSLERRSDPSGEFSFVPAGASAAEPWTWIPARRVFEWLSALPVSAGLVVYPSCPDKFDEYLVGELAYGKRPGSLEVLRVCDRTRALRAAADARSSEEWRARLTGKLVGLLEDVAARRTPLPAAELAGPLQKSFEDGLVDLRRVPEYAREGFVFEPVARGVAGEQDRYRASSSYEELSAILGNVPGLVKTAGDPAREALVAARFLGEVAVSPTAGAPGTAALDAAARLGLRTTAVEALAKMANDPARDALDTIAQRAADAPFVRRSALTQLSRLTPARPADLAAVRAAFGDGDPAVREAAVRTAVVLNDTGGVAALQARLDGETESAVRVALVQALAALGARDRASLLRLLGDPDVAVRRETAAALGRLGRDAGATASLIERLRGDESQDVRRQAAYALGRTQPEPRVVDGRPQDPLPEVASALLDALRAGPSPVREAAAWALGRTGGRGTEDALRGVLRGGDTEAERAAAAEALGQLRSGAAVNDLVAALRDPDRPGLRRAAASALGSIGTPEAVAALGAALDDRDPLVQRQAQQALDQLPVSGDAVLRGLRSDSTRVRLAALRQVGTSADPALVPALVDALGDADAEVRRAAVAALSAYRDPPSIELLARAGAGGVGATPANRQQQLAVITALAAIPRLEATRALIPLAQGQADPALRVEALAALRTQADWLSRAVEDAPAREKAEERRALGDVTRVALEAAAEESPAARKAAVGVLAAVPDGRDRLEQMAKADVSADVRAAAIDELRRAGLRKDTRRNR